VIHHAQSQEIGDVHILEEDDVSKRSGEVMEKYLFMEWIHTHGWSKEFSGFVNKIKLAVRKCVGTDRALG
jgi:hypothetical protein